MDFYNHSQMAFCGQIAFRGRGGVKKGPKTAVILNVWPLKVVMSLPTAAFPRSRAKKNVNVALKGEKSFQHQNWVM